MIDKKCKNCGINFRVGNYREKTAFCCSRKCYNELRDKNTKTNICLFCGKEFKRKNNPQREYTFCSIKCFAGHKSQKAQIKKSCLYCHNDFFVTKKQEMQKFCSCDCANKFKDKGKTPLLKKLRTSLKYRQWRESVFRRDNWTCQECGQKGGKLNADHLKRFAHYPELRFDIDNGRTLCEECHRKTKNFGNKKLNDELLSTPSTASVWDCVAVSQES